MEDAAKAAETLAKTEKDKQAVQGELDDLLMVFGDLEDKVTKYKDQVKKLGGSVSDGEGDEDDSDEDGSDATNGVD